MSTFYGSDISCTTDRELTDTVVSDPRLVIGQRLVRRLSTPRGALALINDDPNGGWDVRQYVNARMTSADIATAKAQIESECLKDEAVESVAVDISLVSGVFTIGVKVQSSAGPFALVLNVNQLTVDAVFNFGGG